jgi:dipeptidyl aminopeptidase/acylaminoacyl peptidase
MPVLIILIGALALISRNLVAPVDSESSLASALRAGDLAAAERARPANQPPNLALALLSDRHEANATLRERAIAELGRGDPTTAHTALQAAVIALPTDRDAQALLVASRDGTITALQGKLDRALAAGNGLAVERAAAELALLLAGDAAEPRLRALRDAHAPIALARESALWLVDPSGSDGRVLTANVSVARPVWSPDRSTIAFVSADPYGSRLPARLFIVDAEGGDLRSIYDVAHPNAVPSWSPTGDRIALTSVAEWSMRDERGRLSVQIVPTGGGPTIDIAAATGSHATTPAWSPDGRSIAFIARPLEEDLPGYPLSGPAEVMLWGEDGEVRNLTAGRLSGANRLLWSRDGRQLIVLSRDSSGSGATTGAMTSISEIDVATGEISLLDDRIPASSSGWSPAAAPSGNRLAWVAGARTVIVRDETGTRTAIDTGRLLSGALTWSPGGGALLAIAAEPARPSARIDFLAGSATVTDVPLRYDLEWPTGTPQWTPALAADPETPAVTGTGLDRD